MSTGAEATADGLIRSTSCDPSFAFGRAYLVFANGTSHETMRAHGCSFTGQLGDGGLLTLLDGIVSRRQPSPDVVARDFVAVVGSVRTPGLVGWRPGMTVADALELAGGAIAPVRREFAELKLTSSISRNRIGDSNSFPALPSTPLRPDDSLFVAGDLARQRH